MSRKIFFLFIFVFYYFCIHSSSIAADDNLKATLPLHFIVLMPSDLADSFGDDAKNYEGVSFPLYCGIISLYPKENKFIFTKMTELPILAVKTILHPLERDGYLTLYPHRHSPVQIPVESFDFDYFFLGWIGVSGGLSVHKISRGQEIPVNVVPRFTKTCRYTTEKDPPTVCAHRYWDIDDLYIPFTEEEIKQIAKDHAK